MDLLVRYGEALGATRLVETNNVIGVVGAGGGGATSPDAAFSEFCLDSQEVVEIPHVKAYSCHVIRGMDPEHWQMQGIAPEVRAAKLRAEKFCARVGINMMYTCAPYLVGNVPVKGEHCAWMESSAVVYCNSVLGGRTNTEGSESAGAAMLVGRIPYWGYHLDENRLGTHLVKVEIDVESVMDWGLLGYYAGEIVQEKVPVIDGIKRVPNIDRLKHCGAAAASSGGIELYHVVGITPEAQSLEVAFGKKKPVATLKYGAAERRQAYENLTSATDRDVDFVMLGCPHYTLEQLWNLCKLLEGKRVHSNTSLWVFTPRALKEIADSQGYTEMIAKAGGTLMTDTCPAIARIMPKGTKTAATDSAKHAHYMPPILGVPTWFGSQEDCVRAAVTGKWEASLEK
jgi:hypothetical protein